MLGVLALSWLSLAAWAQDPAACPAGLIPVDDEGHCCLSGETWLSPRVGCGFELTERPAAPTGVVSCAISGDLEIAGDRVASEVIGALALKRASVGRCADDALGPGQRADVAAALTFLPSGAPSAVRIRESTLDRRRSERCVRGALRLTRLPPVADADPSTITVLFTCERG